MSRLLLRPLIVAGSVAATSVLAADSIEVRELRELRQTVEQQSKQIEALIEHVSKLTQAIEAQKATAASAPAGSAAPPAGGPPASAAPGESAAGDRSAEVPKAEAAKPESAAASGKHVVSKGETLTSIAKQHNVTISELQKVNKIENDRKLQIGQTLTIPAPKPSEAQPEKKENP